MVKGAPLRVRIRERAISFYVKEKNMNIAIVEDTDADAENLESCINRYMKENNLCCTVKRFKDGMDFLDKYSSIYDIIFMDVDMPYKNGINVSAKLREIDEAVTLVFVTRLKQYAIDGYSVDASDFLLKPIVYDVFVFHFKRVLEIARNKVGAEITLISQNEKMRLKVNDIDFVEVKNHKCIFHTGDKVSEMWITLKNVSEQLIPFGFAFCNSGYLVNLNHIKNIKDDMVYVGNDCLKMSRPRRKEFFKAFFDVSRRN